MKRIASNFLMIVGLPILLIACNTPVEQERARTPVPSRRATSPGPVTVEAFTPNPRREDGESYFVNKLLPFDGIRPVYEPAFAPAAEVTLVDDALVMGVAFDGAAKAYPVSVLAHREMVNDELRGIPILVSW